MPRYCPPLPAFSLWTLSRAECCAGLHVEYAYRGNKYGILFIFSLFCEYINLEYLRFPVIYKVNQAEYVIHIRVAASQEYVDTYSTCRAAGGIEAKQI